MKTRERKAKGKRLQNWVRDKILSVFSQLTSDDVRSTTMGEHGADIQLSSAAKKYFPYSIECKNQEVFKGIYNMYQQAAKFSFEGEEPLLIIKMNRQKPLAVIDAEKFLENSNYYLTN